MEDNIYTLRKMLIKIISEEFCIKENDVVESCEFNFDKIYQAVYNVLDKVLRKKRYIILKRKGKKNYQIDDRGKDLVRTLFYSVVDIEDKNSNSLPKKTEIYVDFNKNEKSLIESYMAKFQYKNFMKSNSDFEVNYFTNIFNDMVDRFIYSSKEIARRHYTVIKVIKKSMRERIELGGVVNIKNRKYKKMRKGKKNELKIDFEDFLYERYLKRLEKLEQSSGDITMNRDMYFILRNNGYNYYKNFKETFNFDFISLIRNSKIFPGYIDSFGEEYADEIADSVAISYVNEFCEFYETSKKNININLLKTLNKVKSNTSGHMFNLENIKQIKLSQLSEKEKFALAYNTFVIFNEVYFDRIIVNFAQGVDPTLYSRLKKFDENN